VQRGWASGRRGTISSGGARKIAGGVDEEVRMHEGSFRREIEAHLELQRRNSRLEATMPISGYRETAAAEALDVDPPTAVTAHGSGAPWDDPDSWWNVRDPTFDWNS
jgi:hypothetical protein